MGVGSVYKAGEAGGPYDAIVVGSGMGGLSAAAMLARAAGWRCLVLERHYVAGGFTHVFKRPGFEWDVGVHYVGEVLKPRAALRRVFDHVSEGRLEWAPMDEVYDRIVVDQWSFDFHAGAEHFVEGLMFHFPGERPTLATYVALLREVARDARGYFGSKALPSLVGAVAGRFMGRTFRRLAARTTADVLGELGASPELLGVLTGQYGNYGLPPGRSSFAMHALVARHYLDGAAYPLGGASRIAASVAPTIEKAGGRLLVAAEVAEIVLDGSRVEGVRLASGETLRAPVVISDAGVFNTFGRLLGQPPPGWGAERLREARPSLSHVCLYLGLRGTAEELELPRTNLWIYPGFDHDANVERYLSDPESPLPVVYVSFPSAKDPDWERRHPGTSTIEVISLAPYEWFEGWQAEAWRRRGPEYEALKTRLTRRLTDALLRQMPSLKGRIVRSELSTPLSTRHFAGHPRGEIYGLEHTPARFALDWLTPRTPVKGLYLTGQDVATGGVAGALLGGVLTASAILGKNLLGQLLAEGR